MSKRLQNIFQLCTVTAALLFLTGCETLSYYYQAVEGHLSILNQREAIEDLVESDIDEKTKSKLQVVLTAREFASAEMHLPVAKNYAHYVDLERDFVVWNVVAAPEFSIKPKSWCYPVVGCLSYRGYYSKSAAEAYAETLRQQSLDVYTGGVAAYSTLGWFNDPVLNTFLRREDASLASLIFHEMAHQLLYFKDDTTFNESFATTVELEGLKRWMKKYGDSNDLKKRENYLQHKTEFLQMLLTIRSELDTIYSADQTDTEKRKAKAEFLQSIESKYDALAKDWDNPKLFSGWFKHPINNARLSTVATYHDQVKPLQALLAKHNHDLPKFYKICQDMEHFTVEERRKHLKSLLRDTKSP